MVISEINMNKTSLDKCSDVLRIPGIGIDIYQAYQFSLQMNSDKIVIITDIIEDPQTNVLKEAIFNEIVDGNILNFIKDIKEKGYYYIYTNLETMIDKIKDISKDADELFFYYTGHSKNKQLLLPNDFLSITCLREILINSTKKYCNILLLFDCCYGIQFELPYKLKHNHKNNCKFHYSLITKDLDKFTTQHIICLSSSSGNENSGITRLGSIFTRIIFKLLKEKKTSINLLLDFINKESRIKFKQTASAYSSYPDLYHIWSSFYGNEHNITIDPIKNVLIIYNPYILS